MKSNWSDAQTPFLALLIAKLDTSHMLAATWHALDRQTLVACLTGYLYRMYDVPPGWQTLWREWTHVLHPLEGVHLAAHFPSS